MKSRGPLLSVIIPTYGRPQMLSEAIGSALDAAVGDIEILVVDDHPTISASECPRYVGRDHRVRVLRSGPSAGGAIAKNCGAEAAHGEILLFLDDDDVLCPDACSRIMDAFKRNPEIEVLCLEVACFGPRSAEIQAAHARGAAALLARHKSAVQFGGVIRLERGIAISLCETVPISFQNFAVRKDSFNRIGGFRKECVLWDNEWMIRAALELRTAFLPGAAYMWRLGEQNLFSHSRKNIDQDLSVIGYLKSLREARLIRDDPKVLSDFDVAFSNVLYRVARRQLCERRLLKGLYTLIGAQRRHHVPSRWLTLGRVIIGSDDR